MKSTFSQFISDFSDLIERTLATQTKIVLAGDFNIRCDLPLDPHTSCSMTLVAPSTQVEMVY